jgi:hypothetical protein
MLFPNGMKVCLAGCAWRARGKRVRAHRMQSDSAPTAPARGCIFGPSGVAELSSDDDSLRRCACERGFCFGKVFLTNRKRISERGARVRKRSFFFLWDFGKSLGLWISVCVCVGASVDGRQT